MNITLSGWFAGIGAALYLLPIYHHAREKLMSKKYTPSDVLDDAAAVMFGVSVLLVSWAVLDRRDTFWGPFLAACSLTFMLSRHWEEIFD